MLHRDMIEVGDIILLNSYVLVATHQGKYYLGFDVIRSCSGALILSDYMLSHSKDGYYIAGRVRGK